MTRWNTITNIFNVSGKPSCVSESFLIHQLLKLLLLILRLLLREKWHLEQWRLVHWLRGNSVVVVQNNVWVVFPFVKWMAGLCYWKTLWNIGHCKMQEKWRILLLWGSCCVNQNDVKCCEWVFVHAFFIWFSLCDVFVACLCHLFTFWFKLNILFVPFLFNDNWLILSSFSLVNKLLGWQMWWHGSIYRSGGSNAKSWLILHPYRSCNFFELGDTMDGVL